MGFPAFACVCGQADRSVDHAVAYGRADVTLLADGRMSYHRDHVWILACMVDYRQQVFRDLVAAPGKRAQRDTLSVIYASC